MPCAASPPSAFCQEKVTTSSFWKSRFWAKAAEVASQMVRPSRSAGIQSAFGTRTPEVVPFQVKTTSRREIDLLQVGEQAVVGLDGAGVGELELLHHVGHPAEAEALPGEHVDLAGAEQRPQRHLERAGVGGRHDADQVSVGDLEHLAGEVDGFLELLFADLGAVRPAKGGTLQPVQRPAGALGTGTGGEVGIGRPRGRQGGIGHVIYPLR